MQGPSNLLLILGCPPSHGPPWTPPTHHPSVPTLYLGVVAQALRVQPGLQHAVLDEDQVCGVRGGCRGGRGGVVRVGGSEAARSTGSEPGRACCCSGGERCAGSCEVATLLRAHVVQGPSKGIVPPKQGHGYLAYPPLRRCAGVAATTPARSSLRVHTTIGPDSGPLNASPLRTTTCMCVVTGAWHAFGVHVGARMLVRVEAWQGCSPGCVWV